MSAPSAHPPFDLTRLALNDLHEAGFRPEFDPAVQSQVEALERSGPLDPADSADTADLRHLPWSSIDNDTSRDLDQIEAAEEVDGGIRLHVAIADVAALVAQGTPIDEHAAAQTQTVYTPVHNFPMLPNELSTGLTSLNQDADRLAVVLSFTVDANGNVSGEEITRASVSNKAQLAYSRVGPWLEQSQTAAASFADLRAEVAPAQAQTNLSWLGQQLRLQDRAAQALLSARQSAGALDFARAEADPVVLDGRITGLKETVQNRAMKLIENLMVAANGVMARTLREGGRSGLQRVVRRPQRWDRIVSLAAEHGTHLPEQPDSLALNNFLQAERQKAPDTYPDLALAVLKLMGAGEYMLVRPEDTSDGHFALAATDYAHSTAPNRRYPDLVTQRVLHALLAGEAPPYTDDQLETIAEHCNTADKALRKLERSMRKRVAAVALGSHIGQTYRAVVTGASPKGTYVRVLNPPVEGRVVQGEAGLDVGDSLQVRLLHTDPARAFIDFARVN